MFNIGLCHKKRSVYTNKTMDENLLSQERPNKLNKKNFA